MRLLKNIKSLETRRESLPFHTRKVKDFLKKRTRNSVGLSASKIQADLVMEPLQDRSSPGSRWLETSLFQLERRALSSTRESWRETTERTKLM